MENLRPVAVPLVTVDPYFSIWSCADNLYDDYTRHWTGRSMNMCGMIRIDGDTYKFMGKRNLNDVYYTQEPKNIKQTSVKVYPMHTEYVFENDIVKLNLNFLTPLLLNRLEIASRPVSYIYYDVEIKDNKEHKIELYFDVQSEVCVDKAGQKVKFEYGDGWARVGNVEQNILAKSGDDLRIDWGYFYFIHKNADVNSLNLRYQFTRGRETDPFHSKFDKDAVYDAMAKGPVTFTITDKLSDVIVLAYDDIKSIEYFNEHMDAYYKKHYKTFENMLKCAVEDFEDIKKEVYKAEKEILDDAKKVSEEYADLIALSYRQAIAAHKIVTDDKGDVLFLSKECYSNGCIATVDVTYPSIPMFLKYNTELVKGMIRPIMRYYNSGLWPYKYAPHDCGTYPKCNAQVYSMRYKIGMKRADNDEIIKNIDDVNSANELGQMPVEECGNMLLIFAAISKWENSLEYATKYKETLKIWVDYLVEYGYNPEFQLCTDDFAGKLAHNCNLSLKAILGIAAYAKMFGDEKYLDIAKDYAKRWIEDTKTEKSSALTFDTKDTWSLKYNIVWDRLLDINIFDKEVSKREQAFYLTKLNRYGVPLDSREDYTKIDWLAWTTVMTDDKEYTDKIYKSIWNMLNESETRVPITDWYYTTSGDQRTHVHPNMPGHTIGFQNRTVLGGVFINML
ncbi:MAG: DUF4965 domain-containing protein [Ruminococcaceae bacterium]|nr:DUF4965 domain-containing protein [Oscillospiraceae bacterium]